MAQTTKKTKVVGNPGRRAFGSGRPAKKKYKRPASGHRPRPNPGQIIGFTLGNPGRKASMAKTSKKSKSHHRPKGYGDSAYKGNPGHVKHHKKRYHHNPAGLGSVGPLVTNAIFVIVGALGSKLGAQMVLGTNNVGLIGYAGNLGAGGVLWFLAERVMKNRAAASGILAGTVVQIVLRLINDYTPFGQYVSQLGMGDYQMQSFVTPQVLVDPWNSAQVQIPPGWAPAGAPPALPASAGGIVPAGTPMPPAAGGMSGLYDNRGWGGANLY